MVMFEESVFDIPGLVDQRGFNMCDSVTIIIKHFRYDFIK